MTEPNKLVSIDWRLRNKVILSGIIIIASGFGAVFFSLLSVYLTTNYDIDSDTRINIAVITFFAIPALAASSALWIFKQKNRQSKESKI